MDLREKYESLEQRKKEMDTEISALGGELTVQRYLSLCAQRSRLIDLKDYLYQEMKKKEYSTCEHIWVTSLVEYDNIEGHTSTFCGCMKCGLDRGVIPLKEQGRPLNVDQTIMYNLMRNNCVVRGIDTKVWCDLDLARAIYSRISLSHPGIDDETAVMYFENSLDHIRNVEVSEERTAGRVKRLSLDPGFNRWKESDIKD